MTRINHYLAKVAIYINIENISNYLKLYQDKNITDFIKSRYYTLYNNNNLFQYQNNLFNLMKCNVIDFTDIIDYCINLKELHNIEDNISIDIFNKYIKHTPYGNLVKKLNDDIKTRILFIMSYCHKNNIYSYEEFSNKILNYRDIEKDNTIIELYNIIIDINKFTTSFITETDKFIIYYVWDKVLKTIRNIKHIEKELTINKTKHDISKSIQRTAKLLDELNTSEVDKFMANNVLQPKSVYIFDKIKQMVKVGGSLNKQQQLYTTIYEQIFNRIQKILAEYKIKLNQEDINRINQKIKEIKESEKQLIEAFKTMVEYTSLPYLENLKNTETNYDTMLAIVNQYKYQCKRYKYLTDNITKKLDKLNIILEML